MMRRWTTTRKNKAAAKKSKFAPASGSAVGSGGELAVLLAGLPGPIQHTHLAGDSAELTHTRSDYEVRGECAAGGRAMAESSLLA